MQEEAKVSLARGSICQFNPSVQRRGLRGCFMVVTEPKNWGAVGYVMLPNADANPAQRVEVSAQFAEIDVVGKAKFYSTRTSS